MNIYFKKSKIINYVINLFNKIRNYRKNEFIYVYCVGFVIEYIEWEVVMNWRCFEWSF